MRLIIEWNENFVRIKCNLFFGLNTYSISSDITYHDELIDDLGILLYYIDQYI